MTDQLRLFRCSFSFLDCETWVLSSPNLPFWAKRFGRKTMAPTVICPNKLTHLRTFSLAFESNRSKSLVIVFGTRPIDVVSNVFRAASNAKLSVCFVAGFVGRLVDPSATYSCPMHAPVPVDFGKLGKSRCHLVLQFRGITSKTQGRLTSPVVIRNPFAAPCLVSDCSERSQEGRSTDDRLLAFIKGLDDAWSVLWQHRPKCIGNGVEVPLRRVVLFHIGLDNRPRSNANARLSPPDARHEQPQFAEGHPFSLRLSNEGIVFLDIVPQHRVVLCELARAPGQDIVVEACDCLLLRWGDHARI